MSALPEIGKNIDKDAWTAFEAVSKGGIAIVYLDVAYSILARSEAAVKKIYSVKKEAFQSQLFLSTVNLTHLSVGSCT